AWRAFQPWKTDSDALRCTAGVFPDRVAAGRTSVSRAAGALRSRGGVTGADCVLDDVFRSGASTGNAVDGSDRRAATYRRVRHAHRVFVQPGWIHALPGCRVDLRRPGSRGSDDARESAGDDADAHDHEQGVAAVPRASLVILSGTLATFGLPLEGVAIILGVDALMDMA